MFPGQCGNTAFFFKSQPDQFHFEFRGIVFPGKSFFSAHEVSTCKISGCLSYRILDSGPDGTQTTLTLKDLSSQLRQLQKQIPFATAQAMTKVVRQIEAAQKTAFEQNLDNPTPFTVKSVGSVGARKNSLRAKVFVRDTAAGYLEPFEFGGAHKLNGGALLNPKDIKLNKYGNLPRNKLSQLKAKPNVFIGDVGGVNAVWQRKKPKTKKGKKRAKRSPNGTRRDKIKQPAPKLLIRFGDALPVKPTLGYMDRANTMANALLPSALHQAIAEAISSAR